MSSHPLLRFTPSALPPADLEAILVKREPLAAETVELVRGFANGDGPPMRLFVGPRGMGKTHLVAVIANRLTADTSLDGRMQVAWLDEDPYRIRNYATFLAEIQRSLTGERVPPAGLIEGPLEQWLTQQVADAPVVVVVENLDAVFERIGNDGQHRLRSLIENTRRLGFIATATSRFDDLADAQLPFYGMFEVTELDPFTLEEATELVRRIATRSGDQQLLDFLKRPQSQQRLKVVQHLTGGHPRIWLLLASSLSIDALDEVIPIFMDSLDQLTPYYQGRIQEVSPDQQAIVMALIDAEGATTVKDIAALVQVDERAAASQLGLLVRRGYVRVAAEPSVASSGDARRSYYELREPLMRLNLKVKEARGAPLEVVVAFLRAWFGAQLLDRPEAPGIGGLLGIQYVQHAIGPELLNDPTFMSGTMDELRTRALSAAPLYPDRVEPVRAPARSDHQTDSLEAAIARLDQRLTNNPTPADRSQLLAERGNALESNRRWNEALECYTEATLSDSSNAQAHAWMGRCLFSMGRHDEALAALDTAIELDPTDAGAHTRRGYLRSKGGDQLRALDDLNRAVELDATDRFASGWRDVVLARLGRYDEAIQGRDTVARERPDDGDIDAIAVYLLARLRSQTASCLSRSIAAWGEQSPELAKETEWLVSDLAVDLLRGRLVNDLVVAYSSADSLDQIGNAIVASLATLLPRLSSDELTDWERQWSAASRNLPALDVPLTLMNAGIAWWRDRDRAHLLALPQELRSVLEAVLTKATAQAPLPQGRAKAQPSRTQKR
jgi:tetratricopeptide (TPR) repeat protein